MFFDLIIEDDEGETEVPEEIVPYQLSKEAVVLDIKVKDMKVCTADDPVPSYTCLVDDPLPNSS